MASEWQVRRDIVEVGRRLYQVGMMSGSDGNLSVMLNPGEILITPSRVWKGFMDPGDIIKINGEGQKLSGKLNPSLETPMHLAAYQEREDICAVVHAHPPFCTAFTVAGYSLPRCVLPEVEVLFGGDIPIASYATPGGPDVADSIRQPIREKDVVLLAHHGALSVGLDIVQAGMRMEHAEASARVVYYARQLGGERALPEQTLEGLRALRQRLTETERSVFCAQCRVCEPGGAQVAQPARTGQGGSRVAEDELTAAVRRAVKAVLESRT